MILNINLIVTDQLNCQSLCTAQCSSDSSRVLYREVPFIRVYFTEKVHCVQISHILHMYHLKAYQCLTCQAPSCPNLVMTSSHWPHIMSSKMDAGGGPAKYVRLTKHRNQQEHTVNKKYLPLLLIMCSYCQPEP